MNMFRASVMSFALAAIMLLTALAVLLQKAMPLLAGIMQVPALQQVAYVIAAGVLVAFAAGLPTNPPVCLYVPSLLTLLRKITPMVFTMAVSVGMGCAIGDVLVAAQEFSAMVALSLALMLTIGSFGWSGLLALGHILQHRRDCVWARQHA